MIDWSQAPEWVIGAAMDEDWSWYWLGAGAYKSDSRWESKNLKLITPRPEPVVDWRESYIEKPKKNMFTETKTTKTTTEIKNSSIFEEGGPVYPSAYGNIHDGISLRDYFAGQALISMAGHSISIAKEAYQIADAMLEARTMKPE